MNMSATTQELIANAARHFAVWKKYRIVFGMLLITMSVVKGGVIRK